MPCHEELKPSEGKRAPNRVSDYIFGRKCGVQVCEDSFVFFCDIKCPL